MQLHGYNQPVGGAAAQVEPYAAGTFEERVRASALALTCTQDAPFC